MNTSKLKPQVRDSARWQSGCISAGWDATATGRFKPEIDAVWNDFRADGIFNPLEVMQQLTCPLFIGALNKRQNLVENRANRTSRPIINVICPRSKELLLEGLAESRPYSDLRWSLSKITTAAGMSNYDEVDYSPPAGIVGEAAAFEIGFWRSLNNIKAMPG